MALLAKTVAKCNVLTPKKRNRGSRRHHIAEDSSEDESSSSDQFVFLADETFANEKKLRR